jgi:hypothetical protein
MKMLMKMLALKWLWIQEPQTAACVQRERWVWRLLLLAPLALFESVVVRQAQLLSRDSVSAGAAQAAQ